MLHYCYECPETSIAKMASTHPFDEVSQRTLENWSSSDRWAERRRRAEERWLQRIEKALGDQLLEQRRRQLSWVEELESGTRALLESGRFKFKSLEGGVRAYVRLVELAEELRTSVIGGLEQPNTNSSPQLRATLSDEEKDEVRRSILGFREGGSR